MGVGGPYPGADGTRRLEELTCSFCGLPGNQAEAIVANQDGDAAICAACIELGMEIVIETRMEPRRRTPPPSETPPAD